MITDSKKVLVRMRFKNDDVFDFRPSMPEERGYEYRDDEEYDEDFDSDIDSDLDEDYADECDGGFEDCDVREQGDLRLKPDEGVEIVTEGYVYRKDGRIVLRYAEAESTDLANEFTVLSYEEGSPDILTMERNGICRTVMVFEEGRRYLSMYSVSGMTMELVVRTYELENTLTLDGGCIRLGYTLENGGSTVSSVKMEINTEVI